MEYRLSMPNPYTHLLEVEVRIPATRGPLELVMPSWTPGSYLLREFPRNVQDFRAESDSGAALAWSKTDKNTWRVEGGGAEAVRAAYRVYANEISVRTSHLDASHACVNGASVFMFARGREREPLRLEIKAPAAWRATTSLPAEGPFRFRAASYDELVDCPIEIGTHEVLAWEQQGIPHRFAIWGRADYDPERLVADTRKIVQAAAALFDGSLPYERFTFILHLVPGGRGGLEHASSTLLQATRDSFAGEGYESLLALVAHEFFHVWNAKRIRPEPLGPFDYTRENYTRNLWVVEGLTTYYTDLILRRAGLMTPERYLARLSESIARLQALPGRRHQSLEESSFDAWIKFYRPNEHTPNSQISYYQKGALVGLLLDLEIRRATANRRSLDDVMRLLWDRYGSRDRSYPEDARRGIQALAEEVSGTSLEGFFDAHVRGTEELDYAQYLRAAGLRFGPPPPATAPREGLAGTTPAPSLISDTVAQETRLGIRTQDRQGRAEVVNVFADTPAYAAGVNAGDEIVALDGQRVTHADLPTRLRGREEGTEVTLTLSRRDEILTLPVALGPHPVPRARIVPVAAPTEAQRAVLRGWLGVGEGGLPSLDREPRGG